MEVSVIGTSQGTFCGGGELVPHSRDMRFCVLKTNGDALYFFDRNSRRRCRNSRLQLTLTAAAGQSEPVRSDSFSVQKPATKPNSINRVRLFVGLPMDVVSDCHSINHARAITAGLKALKLLGVEGVELPVWWGLVEKEGMGEYEWSGYRAVAEMVQAAGLKLHVSLCFHGDRQHQISLPRWVTRIGESNRSIFYTDRSGKAYEDCLSLAVDDLQVLGGKTPLQVYKGFCESFRSSFAHLLGSTITGVTMGLGPDGELRYPSHHSSYSNANNIPGVGEFQCYDENMMKHLKQHAASLGNPSWGLTGPHNAPTYNQSPESNSFFDDPSGSWQSPYGDFFLSWYSNQLLSHGDRLLSMASDVFSNTGVATHGRVPLMHCWVKTRSRALENTAGFYSNGGKDAYGAVAKIFARNSCGMIVPGMDLSDDEQPEGLLSSPEMLVKQIGGACKRHGVGVCGMNSKMGSKGFDRIKENIRGDENVIDLFSYQRMGAEFFSPGHFPSFTQFARGLNQSFAGLDSDDLPTEETVAVEASSAEMQTA